MLLDADKCRVRPMLYYTNSSGAGDHLMTELAERFGWDIFQAPKVSEHGLPFIKNMYMDAFKQVPGCSYYMYSNGDILYSYDILETLEETSRVSKISTLLFVYSLSRNIATVTKILTLSALKVISSGTVRVDQKVVRTIILYPIHTADAYATQLNCRVESRRRRRCVLNSQLAHDDCRRKFGN